MRCDHHVSRAVLDFDAIADLDDLPLNDILHRWPVSVTMS
jgi:hypothetical protein